MGKQSASTPDPLPYGLPTGRGLAAHVFIRQSILKRTAMQIQRHDITGGERALGKLRA
jgi:hypothetical protein